VFDETSPQKILYELFGLTPNHPYWEIESAVPNILEPLSQIGLRVDEGALANAIADAKQKLDAVKNQIQALSGPNIEFSSTEQLRQYLFEDQQLTPLLLTPTGQPSVSVHVLDKYADKPVVVAISQWRSLRATLSYLIAFWDSVLNHRVKTEFVHWKCPTGRIYTKNFNIQQIPVDGRDCIVPDDGKTFVYLDYKQQEMRILLSLAEETSAYPQIMDGVDIHSLVISRMLDIPIEAVTKDQREIGKMLSYAMCYGMSVHSLAFKLNISIEKASSLMRQYFETYPKVTEWLSRQRQYAKEHKCIVSYFGYKRDLAKEFVKDYRTAYRMSVNTPIQSASATILKKAIWNLSQLANKGIELTCAIVHDSILLQVDKDADREQVEKDIRNATEFQFPGWLPLQVEVGWGQSWAEASKKLPENDFSTVSRPSEKNLSFLAEMQPYLDLTA